ncbi:MAG: sensor histidine kinase [Kiritimatiellia bacterium]|nr:sensor histidine kinase [Kiritimatiellia bacterium]
MKAKGLTLLNPYQTGLRRYIRQGTATSLRAAKSLGRRANALGMETLDLARIHEQALLLTLETLSPPAIFAQDRIARRAGTFFAEAILPLEATHHAALKAADRLGKLNQALSRRTRELLASNRKLTREIARRTTAQDSLRKSEAQSLRLLAQSRHLQEQLRLLSRRILLAQEEERKQISRELHDVIAQMLTGINIQLSSLKMDVATNTKGLSRKITRAQRLVEKSVDRVHVFARRLRPAVLDDLGLIPAVHSYLKRYMVETGIQVKLTAFTGVEALGITKRTVLYRVVLEALTNIARHAQASRVDVIIQKLPRTVRLQIKDDGKGFNVDQMWRERKRQHLGMLGMRERLQMVGGTFTIESTPAQGTIVQAQIPYSSGSKESADR